LAAAVLKRQPDQARHNSRNNLSNQLEGQAMEMEEKSSG